jgi:transcriptional regulator with XRE-family HTH domain
MKRANPKKDAPRGATAIDTFIGDRMRERRHASNMTQKELGKALGVSCQKIQKYEKGYNRINAARLYDICTVLNVSLSTMFERAPRGIIAN